jgi:HD-GYP domain-containing protein (c-di-GMP phosphodiesterase class II)
VCDAFDAMTSDRPYRAATTSEAALAELARCAGTQFDADVVRAFSAITDRAGAAG